MVPVMVFDGSRDNDGVRAMMAAPVAAAVIVEGDRAVMAVMEAVAFVVDDDGGAVMMVPVMRPDDDIGLGGRSHGGCRDAESQGS